MHGNDSKLTDQGRDKDAVDQRDGVRMNVDHNARPWADLRYPRLIKPATRQANSPRDCIVTKNKRCLQPCQLSHSTARAREDGGGLTAMQLVILFGELLQATKALVDR